MPYRPFSEQNCSIAAALADRRRALDAARDARRPLRAAALRRDQAQPRRRAEHPQRPPRSSSSSTACSSAGPISEGSRLPRVRADGQGPRRQPDPDRAAAAGATSTRRPPGPAARRRCTRPAATTPTRSFHCSHCGEVIERGQLESRPGPGATPKQLAEGILPKSLTAHRTGHDGECGDAGHERPPSPTTPGRARPGCWRARPSARGRSRAG